VALSSALARQLSELAFSSEHRQIANHQRQIGSLDHLVGERQQAMPTASE
jgi:hypothetical protein